MQEHKTMMALERTGVGGVGSKSFNFQATLTTPQKYKGINFKRVFYSILFCTYSTIIS